MPFDVGIGLIIGTVLNNNSEFGLVVSIAIGVFAALLPDLDYIFSYLRHRTSPSTEHRDGMHYPLIVVPVVTIAGWMFDPAIGIAMCAGTLSHFLHDSVGIGFGIKWLFPFRRNSYLFLFQIKTPNNKNMPRQRLYSWNDAERADMIQKYGYPDWIRYVYFRPNPWGLFEYAVLVVGVLIVIIR